MPTPAARKPFLELARERVVVLDGAMGSNLQMRTFDLEKDWMGQENISEVLNFTRPEVIQEIHEEFLAAGCDAIETNTFGANEIVLAEADMAERTYENNVAAAKIARAACDKYETPDRPRYVVGAAGGGTKLLTLGMTDWATVEKSYYQQFIGLIDGGSDVLLFETQQDLLIIKAMIVAANRAFADRGKRLPIMVQASFDQDNGQQMLTGSDASAFVAALNAFDEIDVIGLNCAFGPTELTTSVRYIAEHTSKMVSALPNAGLPMMVDGKTVFPMGPADFGKGVEKFVKDYGVNIVGGCCGTLATHIGEVVKRVGVPNDATKKVSAKPRKPDLSPQISSLISAEEIRQDLSYLIVAERTNTNGSKKFRELLQAEDWDGLVGMARDEMNGSHMLDVCVDFVGRDGVRDMHEVVRRYVNAIAAPLMLDSTDPKVLEAGLQLAGGRCVLNSTNLEEGEAHMGRYFALAKKYGAAIVCGCIDEDKENAMARTRERKIEIATRIRNIAVQQGLRDEDLMFDPLVLPISTGIEEDRKNALETIEGTRLISQQLPKCHTVVGLSNVSFGLKPRARVVLNSVFLHELREAGLTGAIVHGSKILPKNRIPDEQWQSALDLIYDRRRENFDPLTHFIGHFPDGAEVTDDKKTDPWENLTLEEALKKHIIDGEKRQLTTRLDAAMAGGLAPLAIINDVLLEGMKVVGELFGKGEMQLPFVLQSAETMKAAVKHLEPFMERAEGSSKGRIVLATVRGDVHDIGKNLVDIILTNNGYTVFNLGIKQPVQDILKACEEKKADAVGMSGLLVKSVAIMKENLEFMNQVGVKVPVLLGGAALTRDYAVETLAELYSGKVMYCKDAFDGLKVMDYISSNRLDELFGEQQERSVKRKSMRENAVKPISAAAANVELISQVEPVPHPPFWGRRMVTGIDPKVIFPFINENALFRAQWGYKRGKLSEADYDTLIETKVRGVFDDLKKRSAVEKFLDPKVVYGFFPCQSDGDDVIIYDPQKYAATKERVEIERFNFPRQQGRRNLCIADFFRPVSSNEVDVVAFQLVTVGDHASEHAEKLRAENRYQDYLHLHGFGVESAEALAEFWHKRIRQELGHGSEDDSLVEKLFQQNYRGSRYSFGYPACPNLEDRAKIMKLLKPEEIGVHLNLENFMLVPEQSTDALVSHHPQAKYFDVD